MNIFLFFCFQDEILYSKGSIYYFFLWILKNQQKLFLLSRKYLEIFLSRTFFFLSSSFSMHFDFTCWQGIQYLFQDEIRLALGKHLKNLNMKKHEEELIMNF